MIPHMWSGILSIVEEIHHARQGDKDGEIRAVSDQGGGKPRPYIKKCRGDPCGHPVPSPGSHTLIPSPARIVLSITDDVLFQPLPTGFVCHLFRVVTYPGGSPLKIRTASTSSTVASS